MSVFFVIILMLSSLFFTFVGCLGLVCLPDVLCRSHALSKALTLGLLFALASLWVFFGADVIGWKIALIIAFQGLTIPITGHLLAFSVWKRKLPLPSIRPKEDNKQSQ